MQCKHLLETNFIILPRKSYHIFTSSILVWRIFEIDLSTIYPNILQVSNNSLASVSTLRLGGAVYKENSIAHLHDSLVIIKILVLTILSPTWLFAVSVNVYTSDSFRPVTFITCTKKSSKHIWHLQFSYFSCCKGAYNQNEDFLTFIGR